MHALPLPAPSRAAMIRRVRLVTGLVLFTYVSTHLTNHALGLVSLAAMDTGREWFLGLWRNPVGTVLLYGSLLVHFGLALWALYLRRNLRMPALEALQLVFGLSILPLLTIHAVVTRLGFERFGFDDSYAPILLNYWKLRIDFGVRQALLLVIVWTHGCIGLHLWLRLKPWYSRFAPWLAALAVLVPVLAQLGFADGGREVLRSAAQPGWIEHAMAAAHAPGADERILLERTAEAILLVFAASVVLTLLARLLRQAYEHRRSAVRIRYPDGRTVVAPLGYSVLETSRLAGIPHASVCGGRGRCSTCRVRIIRGLNSLPPASAEELVVLKRVGAAPNVRLACQLRPTNDLSVAPILPATATARDGFGQPGYLVGKEQEICVLFADLRGFTRLSERKMPYDVVFFLNRYFETMSRAIEQAGGISNQFTGDGVMALFGVESDLERGCSEAVAAAKSMVRGLAAMSSEFAEELGEPLRMGIGIHVGPTIVGRMGHGEAMCLTAVGDTVHVASRLQDLTKQYQCQLIISQTAARRAGIDVSGFPRHVLTVRNRTEPVAIRAIEDLESLTTMSQHFARQGSNKGALKSVMQY
jgi:adenylate cyclase